MSVIKNIEAGSRKEDIRIWIAMYTRPRHEVRVAQQISSLGIEAYVPLHREMHTWSDRKKWIEVPLIPSYVFIHIDLRDYFKIFTVPGIVRPVMFHGRIARLRDNEIELLECAVKSKEPVTVTAQDYHMTDEVEIIGGLFNGHRGRVVQCGSRYKIGIKIEELEYALLIELSKTDIRLLKQTAVVS